MSRLEEIKKDIRDKGLIKNEKLIDDLARQKLLHEKMKDLPNTIQKKIKDDINRKDAS